MTRVGSSALKQDEFDPAPILSVPASSEALGDSIVSGKKQVRQLIEDDETEDGEDLPDDLPDESEEQAKEEDPFEPVIKRILKSQSPSVRDAIQGTECFGKLWYSPDEKNYCPEVECGLRTLCEAVHTQAIGSVEEDVAAKEELAELDQEDGAKLMKLVHGGTGKKVQDDFAKNTKNRKLNKKAKKKAAKAKKETDPTKKKVRRPYVDQNRPIDDLARQLQEKIEPKTLPDNWIYWSVGTKEQREYGQKWFVDKYGKGYQFSQRASYHIYFYNGMHVMRLWVNAAGGGWLDMNPFLAEEMRKRGHSLEPTPKKSIKHTYEFFPQRMKLLTQTQIDDVLDALKKTANKMIVQ